MRFKEVYASCSAQSMLQTPNSGTPTYCMGVLPRYKNKYMKITSMRRKPCIEKNRCLLHSETTTRLNATPAGATRGGREKRKQRQAKTVQLNRHS
jgi:hypothetical protein